MNARIVAAALAFPALVVSNFGRPAGADPANRSLTTTARVSLTIVGSATIGQDLSGGRARFYARGSDDRDLGSEVSIVFRDGRGERVLRGAADVQPAIAAAQRAGDGQVDVTFVF